jgi:hypothetical protein
MPKMPWSGSQGSLCVCHEGSEFLRNNGFLDTIRWQQRAFAAVMGGF